MVSFKEYPTIVRNAAITANETSYPRIENIPKVMTTSWAKAAMAPIAYLNQIR